MGAGIALLDTVLCKYQSAYYIINFQQWITTLWNGIGSYEEATFAYFLCP